VAQYSLFVLKMPLDINQSTKQLQLKTVKVQKNYVSRLFLMVWHWEGHLLL